MAKLAAALVVLVIFAVPVVAAWLVARWVFFPRDTFGLRRSVEEWDKQINRWARWRSISGFCTVALATYRYERVTSRYERLHGIEVAFEHHWANVLVSVITVTELHSAGGDVPSAVLLGMTIAGVAGTIHFANKEWRPLRSAGYDIKEAKGAATLTIYDARSRKPIGPRTAEWHQAQNNLRTEIGMSAPAQTGQQSWRADLDPAEADVSTLAL